MKQKVWAKTLLSSYTCLERVALSIDNLVLSKSINSGFEGKATLMQTDRIINLIQRKKMLINAKVITENAIDSLNDGDLRIIVLRYFDKVKSTDIAKIMEISMRTYFRKLCKAINNFALALEKQGFNGLVLDNMLLDDPWFSRLYDSIYQKELSNKKQVIELDMSELSMLNLAYSSYRNEKPRYYNYAMC